MDMYQNIHQINDLNQGMQDPDDWEDSDEWEEERGYSHENYY